MSTDTFQFINRVTGRQQSTARMLYMFFLRAEDKERRI